MNYFVPVPDERDQFFAFVNVVINNKFQKKIDLNKCPVRPNKIGWVHVSYTYNEVNELFIEVDNLKEKCFVEMLISQFRLIKENWKLIENF